VSEGVQGPYRLRGPGNERFIIVLANSEQVYLDGRLLKRGFDYDYIIDYNLAEITFTANVLITRFSRLRVDFEYSDRIYGRTALSAAHQQQSGKWRFFSNYYLEKDNPLTISLTDADQLLLSQIGDSLHKARVPGVSMLEAYDRNLILYEPKDTLIGSYAYTCYVHSTDPEKARYQLHFTEVGPGKGNYVLVRSVANGRVYEWRAPLNGIPQGTYEAVRLIATPAKKQMLTLGGEFAVSEAESVFTELAFSERDANLFSPLDAADNRGTAWKAGYVNRGKKLAFLPAYEWVGGADVEYTSRYFTAIDRFRDVEYDRDWSARTDTSRADDRIINLSVGIRKSAAAISGSSGAPPAGGDRLLYRFSWRNRGEEINGWQQRVDFGKQIGRWQISADAFRMRSERSRSLSEWQRLRVQTEYRSAYLIPGYVFSLDKNQIRALGQRDSITGSAMNFEEHTFFLKSNDTLPNKFRVEYSVRADNFPLNGRLLKNTQSQTVSSGVQTRLGSHNDLAFTATYRKLENVQLSDHLRTEETLMGRLDWNGNWFADAVRSEATFTAGTGRELRREYVFLPVPAGEGTHTWRDDNNDGRQDLNEFYPAINPDERNFAKFFVPTDQYIRAYSNSLNYRLNLKAPQNWHQGGAFTAFLARFSSVSSWSIHRKLTDDHLYRRFVPFARHIPDESLVSTQELLRSAIFFNRSHPKYGLDLHLQHSGHKQLLTNGFESRQAEEVTYNSRVNLSRNLSVKGVLAQRVQTSQSDFLSGRNYRITGQSLSPELAYQPRASLRISGNYAYSVKKNALTEASDELAVAHQVGLDTRWAKVSKRTMAASLRLIQISYTGPVNTPLGYEMLDALRPGTNWTWSYNLQQRLSNGLQINVSYEGRKSETQRVIHTGRMQVTALF
jgi:hypothetical protein